MIGSLLPLESMWSSEQFPLKGCKITGTCAFRAHTKHDQTLFWLSFLLQPSLLPISCRHKLIRSAQICKQRTVSNTFVCKPTHMVCCSSSQISNTYISIQVHPSLHLMACCHSNVQHLNYADGGDGDATEHGKRKAEENFSGMTRLSHKLIDIWAQRVKPKKLKRGIQRSILPPSVQCRAPPAQTPPPPPSTLHRSAYVVTNDTFIFLQRLCVCKTAEVHQDVKYLGWATQVALEDNQMEV